MVWVAVQAANVHLEFKIKRSVNLFGGIVYDD
jgi:hypothetical protein